MLGISRALFAVAILVLISSPAIGASLDSKPDGSWVSLTGTVTAKAAESFRLEVGKRTVTVEMDDWDWYNEAAPIELGSRVTVYGQIDDGLFEKRTIEAGSVYVFGENTFYYASDADEEDWGVAFPHLAVPEGSWIQLTGSVRSVQGREFVLDTGIATTIQVDTSSMSYDPLDDQGLQRITKGDRVSVSGLLDDADFFETTEIQAKSIVTIEKDRTRKTDS